VSSAESIATNDGGADVWVTAVVANFESSPVEADLGSFTLDTTHGTSRPSPFTGNTPCEPPQVDGGSDARCVVVFEIPPGATPTELAFGSATGPMPAVKPLTTACTQLYGWIDGDDSTCSSCAQQALDGSCYEQVETYLEQCACWSPDDTTNDTCAVESQCDSTQCQELFQTFEQCVASTCSQSCTSES
jgi:hypothetical protein